MSGTLSTLSNTKSTSLQSVSVTKSKRSTLRSSSKSSNRSRKKKDLSSICDDRYKTNEKITYEDRKNKVQCPINPSMLKQYFTDSQLNTYDTIVEKSTGLDYRGDHSLFKIGNRKVYNENLNSHTATTYIYIISKVVSGELYFKVGEGGKNDYSNREKETPGRLGDAQTFLIPGLEEIGYKVHYVFYFYRDFHPYNKDSYIGTYMEKRLHEVLQIIFPQMVIRFPTDKTSEWYKVNENEVNFFIGFILDCCYLYSIIPGLAPLEIWKYELNENNETPNPNDPSKNVDLEKSKDAEKRLETFFQKNTDLQMLRDYKQKLRTPTIRPEEIVVSLKNDPLLEKVKKEYKVNLKPKYELDKNLIFKLDTIGRPSTNRLNPESKRRQHIIYTGLEIEIPDSKINKIKEEFRDRGAKDYIETQMVQVQNDGKIKKILFYLTLKDFLHIEKKKKSKEEYNSWVLKDEYTNLMSTNYDCHVNIEKEDNSSTVLLPSFYFEPAVMDYYGYQYINDIHDDYSENDNSEQFSWKVINYDPITRLITRRTYNKESEELENDDNKMKEESIPVYNMMKLKEVMTAKRGTAKNKWVRVTSNTVKIGKDKYYVDDQIQLRNVFRNIVRGVPEVNTKSEWECYIIDSIWTDENASPEMNPVIDVINMDEYMENNQKKTKCEKSYLRVPFLKGKIRLIKSAPRESIQKPYKTNQILKIIKDGFFSDDKMLKGRWKHTNAHFLRIIHVDRENQRYSLAFVGDTYGGNGYITFSEAEKNLKQITEKEIPNDYKVELPFLLGYKIEKIVGKTNTGSHYLVQWDAEFLNDKRKYHFKVPPDILKKYAESKIKEYENTNNKGRQRRQTERANQFNRTIRTKSKSKSKSKSRTQKSKSKSSKSSENTIPQNSPGKIKKVKRKKFYLGEK